MRRVERSLLQSLWRRYRLLKHALLQPKRLPFDADPNFRRVGHDGLNVEMAMLPSIIRRYEARLTEEEIYFLQIHDMDIEVREKVAILNRDTKEEWYPAKFYYRYHVLVKKLKK